MLAVKNITAFLVPTNASDAAKVELASIAALAAPGGTPESCYVSKLLAAIREFEGGDMFGGDFALDAVIRLWDIMAELVLLEPQLITKIEESYVDVDQLDPGLAESPTPYDPITFDPRVGKTTLRTEGSGKKLNVVLAVDTDAARQAMIDRLRNSSNSAAQGPQCGDSN